ncbi:MAG: hypothetical protein CFE31_07750 [Rhizobiales bacterium PAR1]|nr:MAG: hypothetical protein CFE31_07750 [Rhizobiales bacterium PAR1]
MPNAEKTHVMAELVGPYEFWTFETGADYGLPPQHLNAETAIAALAELPPGADPRTGDIVGDLAGSDNIGEIHVPTVWEPGCSGKENAFWPLVVRVKAGKAGGATSPLARLGHAMKPLAGGIAGHRKKAQPAADTLGFRLNSVMPGETINGGFSAEAITQAYAKSPKSAVKPAAIVAVIDDGLPFAHRDFRGADGSTRVAFCWLQSAVTPKGQTPTVLYGREYLKGEIDELIRDYGHDEDQLYRAAGAGDKGPARGATIRHLGSHGSNVMDLAGGARVGDALDAVALIGVQLPSPITLDTAGFGKDSYILAALHYIFERADRLAEKHLGKGEKLPLIVNFSYGFTGGPHNGQDRLERAMRALIRAREATGAPAHLVIPSGNSFAGALGGEISESLIAARGGAKGTFDIPWRVQPTDRTPNYLEIWLPDGATPQGVSVALRTPSGKSFSLAVEASGDQNTPFSMPGSVDKRAIGQFSVENYRLESGKGRWRFMVVLAPTDPQNSTLASAEAGLWQVKLGGLGPVLKHGVITCRIQRDNDPFGYYHGARQSYFDDRHDQAYDETGKHSATENPGNTFVRRFDGLNGLATHDAVVVVGGYVASSTAPATYSSAGPLTARPGSPGTVRLAAPSDDSPVLGGIRAAGTRSGITFRLNGTSAAAPQVTRALALAYAGKPGATAKPPTPGSVAALIAPHLVAVGGPKDPGAAVNPATRKARLGEWLLAGA